MQEEPSFNNLPVNPPPRLGWLNIVTAICLVLFTYQTITSILNVPFNPSLSDAWQAFQDGFQSGLLVINGSAPGYSATFCFIPLAIWGMFVVVIVWRASRRNKSAVNKLALVGAVVLLGITVVLIGSLLTLGYRPCTALFHQGSDDTSCITPIRPGVPVPTPLP